MPYKNVEERKAYSRTRYATDSIYREKALTRAKQRDPEKVKTYQALWRQRPAAKAKKAAYFKKYQQSHRGYFAESESRRRALKLNTSVEKIDYARVLLRAEGLCQICFSGLGAAIEYDHIVPLARGGLHIDNNLQATHRECNRRKWAHVGVAA